MKTKLKMLQQNLPSLPEDDPDLDLDLRIELVEQRLLARQARLSDGFAAIGERAGATLSSGRVLVPVLAGGAALLLLRMLRRRPAHEHPADRRTPPPRRRGRLATLLWAQAPALALALLQGRGRTASPVLGSSALVTALMPLLRRRLDQNDGEDEPTPVIGVDLQRFAGSWLQLARLPVGSGPATDGLTTLTFTANGRELEVQRRSLRPGRPAWTQQGLVRFVPRSNGAKLQLCFAPRWLRWLPMAWEDHWVLHIEPDYSAALVGSPQRDRLGLLVRRFKGCEAAVNRMLASARLQGFAVDELEFASSQAGRAADETQPGVAHAANR